MNSMERSMQLDELFALRKADKEREAKLLEKLDRMTEQLMNLNESSQMQMKQNEELKQMIADLQKQNELLKKENAALKEQKKQDRKNLYGSKSQKISRKKKEEAPSHEENKDDFDGTSGPSSVSASDEDALSQAPEKKEERPYRKGMSYRRMRADKSVCHDSDFSRRYHCQHYCGRSLICTMVYSIIAERFIRPLTGEPRARCSLLAVSWQMYRQPIIRYSQHTE